jgi:hypothetical protein
LAVQSIQLESPGWVEVCGSLNPLKVIADFISGYRAENTKRMALRINDSIERDKIRAKFATEMMKMMPSKIRAEAPHTIVEVTNAVIVPCTRALESMATNDHVEGALAYSHLPESPTDFTEQPGEER